MTRLNYQFFQLVRQTEKTNEKEITAQTLPERELSLNDIELRSNDKHERWAQMMRIFSLMVQMQITRRWCEYKSQILEACHMDTN